MIRHIEETDYYKGYLPLINIFTRSPQEKSFEEFKEMIQKVYSQNAEIYVIEVDGKIVSSLHLLFEYKLHNNFKLVCHIEDVVTAPQYRKNGYASVLLEHAVQRAIEKNSYKIVLTCNEENTQFYQKNGFLLKCV